ncbi:hypothetical protein BHE74_00051306 [Ensete ventricosum]|nr:hypothetical protein GW17_00026084 [Ensete ventricosum]RWW43073.1 hypothetical protein BHE74_00051306 [Ensete ventricosum]
MMNVLFTFSFLDRRSMSSLLGFRNLMTERRRHNQTRFVASQEGSQYGPRRDKISDGSLLSFRGLKRSARRGKIDAYSAMMVLERYFSMSGVGTELVLPKQLELHEKLRKGPCRDLGF